MPVLEDIAQQLRIAAATMLVIIDHSPNYPIDALEATPAEAAQPGLSSIMQAQREVYWLRKNLPADALRQLAPTDDQAEAMMVERRQPHAVGGAR
jgi:hypothetical protein